MLEGGGRGVEGAARGRVVLHDGAARVADGDVRRRGGGREGRVPGEGAAESGRR